MGPPQRPLVKPEDKSEKAKKEFDINDLSDVVVSSGIDYQEEEKLLAQSYRTDRRDGGPNLQRSIGPSPNQSFDLLARNSFGSIGTSHGSGLFSQTPTKSLEEEVEEAHKEAAREFNELKQYHLEDPFLLGAPVRQRMQKIANDFEVKMPMEGLFDKVQNRPAMSGVSMTNGAGAGVVSVTAPSLLNRGAPLDGILTLLSLAASDRVRGLLEDAYGFARSRQYSSDGVVPPQWTDISNGSDANPTTVSQMSIPGTTWERTKPVHVDGGKTN